MNINWDFIERFEEDAYSTLMPDRSSYESRIHAKVREIDQIIADHQQRLRKVSHDLLNSPCLVAKLTAIS